MGIKGFKPWLKETFPNAFKSILLPKCADLYIDVNPFLHTVGRRFDNESSDIYRNRFMRAVCGDIKNTIRRFFPKRSLYIAMDGMAPLAKFPVQRERRIDICREVMKKNTFDAQHFTPGCLLMASFEEILATVSKQFFFKHESRASRKLIIDHSCSVGEAESKIFAHLNQFKLNSEFNYGAKLLIAEDSDTILYSLASAIYGVKHLFIVGGLNCGSLQLVNVDELSAHIKSNFHYPDNKEKGSSVVSDFVFLSLFNGNDYLPALRGCGIKTVWPLYVDFKREPANCDKWLVGRDGRELNLDVIREFLPRVQAKIARYMVPLDLKIISKESTLITYKSPSSDQFSKCATQSRAHSYLLAILWSLSYIFSKNRSINSGFFDITEYSYTHAPDINEIIQMIETSYMESFPRISLNLNSNDLYLSKYPVIAAMHLLSNNWNSPSFIAPSLKDLQLDYMKKLSSESSYDHLSNICWLKKELDKVPKSNFTALELKASLERSKLTSEY